MYDTVDGTTPTNNAPLRGGKANIYEGGVREPCLVVWPGVTQPGTVSHALVSSIDFLPTLMDMADLPREPDRQLDGVSFAAVLRGQADTARETVFCDFPHYTPATGNMPACSVRQGDWKLIRFFDPGPVAGMSTSATTVACAGPKVSSSSTTSAMTSPKHAISPPRSRTG